MYILSFHPTGSLLSLFLRYWAIFNSLGMKLSHRQKCQKLHNHINNVSPTGVKSELIFALRAAVYEILVYFQNCHILA